MKQKSVTIRMSDREYTRAKMLASLKKSTVTDVLLNGVNDVSTPEKKEGELVMKALAEIISVVHEQNAKIEELKNTIVSLKTIHENYKNMHNDIKNLGLYLHTYFISTTPTHSIENLNNLAHRLLNITRRNDT